MYARDLVQHLAKSRTVTPVVIYCRGDAESIPADVSGVKCADRPLPTNFFSNRPIPPRLGPIAAEHDIDLFHYNTIPDISLLSAWSISTPVVATAHGTLHWEGHPVESLPPTYRVRRRGFDRLSKYCLSHVFTVSGYVKQVLIKKARYAPEQLTTTYQAIDDRFFESDRRPLPDKIPSEYLLHVSNAAPAKNGQTLLEAFELLQAEQSLKLVIAGRGWREQYSETASELGITDEVLFTGFVEPSELVALYDHATCFVFPSLRETFGRPNVEAMARGAPVVTSSTYGIPEIVGEAAVTVKNPLDTDELRKAIEHVLSDESAQRQQINRGHERAKQFSWDRHLDRVTTAYQSVLDGK